MNRSRIKRYSLLLVVTLLLALSSFVVQAADTLVILHTNDTHARLESTSPEADAAPAGGMVKIATLVDELRENGLDNILLLDGGDAWHGTNVANVFEGKSVVEVMNLMGYDAMTLGNHDFNYGQVALAQRKGEAVFPVLAANVLEEGTGEPIAYSALIKPVGDLTVGIIGLVTTETPYVTHPKNVEGLVIADPIARAKSLVSYVRPQADVVIALTHLGFEADQVLAEAVPGIDVIVGGHSHTRLEEPVVIGNTYIVQVGEHAKELGYLELTLEDGQLTNAVRKLVPASADVADNGQVVETVARWGKELEAKMGQEVGTASVILDGERANVRVKETNLGNLVADVMREAVGADIGVNNGGGIRASIAAGPITVGDIYTVLPFDNTLVKVEILGRDLLGALEHSVRLYPEQNGGFLQVSGLEMTFDPSQEAGARVQEVLIGGQALDPDKTYTVATNDFLAAGGDGYTTFTSANILVETGAMLRDAMADHVAAQGSISPEVEGRIVVIE
ncbi:MAG: multifunctional 2',3'-cyclic-nucleotide 2'-phosphodiesterase/5'-nucleotidase/3'-nucleotidase [Firmicutes bacterium]|nr:multifunctional 2',3'-cyclic-nucleotide 2'-phosphodiesterase/5'-nucleotidase/3'-nucleotidase [Bacillota bacterium]